MTVDPHPETFPPLFDLLRALALIFEELRRIQRLITNLWIAPEPARRSDPGAGEDAADLLRRLQGVILQYPLASQAAFSALVAEGRRFASTPEGAAWKAQLAGSDAVRNGRQIWDALALNLLVEDGSTVVPSTLLEALFRAASSAGLETLLSRLRTVDPGGNDGP